MGQDSGLILSAHGFGEYFSEAVEDALKSIGARTNAATQRYLVDVLSFYAHSDNFYDVTDPNGKKNRPTLAEIYLRAMQLEEQSRNDQLKRLADRALYIAGFFSDSLQRKIIDVDYYSDMGAGAYSYLADTTRDQLQGQVFRELAHKFPVFSEVLTVISLQAKVQDESNLLRLYETYAKTGSSYLRDKLLEKGLIAVPAEDLKKPTKQ